MIIPPQRRKLVFQSQAYSGTPCSHPANQNDSGAILSASVARLSKAKKRLILAESGKARKRPKSRQNALEHGSKVATLFSWCLIIKHLCNKSLAFESSASANSATPAQET
jgi:hypothetical protein